MGKKSKSRSRLTHSKSHRKKKPPRVPGVDSKGYLVIKAGPDRDVRVHTLVAEAMLGRKLKPDEEVHHKDENKLNCRWTNLEVLGKKEHGAVSARQRWYLKEHDIQLKNEWDEYFDEGERAGVAPAEVAAAKAAAAQEEKGDTTFP